MGHKALRIGRDAAAWMPRRGGGRQPLAHSVGDAAEQAYRRGDALEERRRLMADWAAFCG
jgi:hypothetical protein